MLSKPIGRCHCDRNFFAAMTFDVKAFNDLMQATKTDPDEWAYPVSADVEVRATPQPSGAVIDKLPFGFVRVMPESAPNLPAFLRIVTPPARRVTCPSIPSRRSAMTRSAMSGMRTAGRSAGAIVNSQPRHLYRSFRTRIGAISASVTALEPISGQSLIAIPYTSHSVIPTVNEPVARSDNARVSRSRRTFSVCGSQHTVVSKAPVAPRRSMIQGNVIHRPYD